MFGLGRRRQTEPEPPSRFYRYRAVDRAPSKDAPARDFDRGQLGSLASTLLDGVLYVPTMGEFNDPWEAAPWYQLPEGNEARALAALHIHSAGQIDHDAGWGPSMVQDFGRQIASRGREATIAEVQARHAFVLASKPVLCLAERPDIPLMWSYYASGHKGYVIEFDAALAPFTSAKPVRYEYEYPTVQLHAARNPSQAMLDLLYVKGEFWRHEHEWRVIRTGQPEPFDWYSVEPPLPRRGRFARLHKGAIKRVIVGSRAEPWVVNNILMLCREADVPMARCQLGAKAFLVIVPPA